MSKSLIFSKLIFLSLALTACGGGGNDGGSENPSEDSYFASINFQGLSSEIEIRLNNQTIVAQDSDGLVEIDNLDLNLGDAYSFTYISNDNQFCRINNASGEVTSFEISIEVNCLTWNYPGSISDNIDPEDFRASEPVVVINDNGDAVIVWSAATGSFIGAPVEIYASVYSNGVWDHPDGLSDTISVNGDTALSPDVTINNNGDAIATWIEFDGVDTQVYASKYVNGIWQVTPTEISPQSADANAPKISMNDNGDAFIVWEEFNSGETHVFRRQDIGPVWVGPTRVDTTTAAGESGYGPEVEVGQNGDVLIVWEQSDGSSYRIFRSHDTGSGFSTPTVLLNVNSPNGLERAGMSIGMNDFGDAIITWEQSNGTNYQIFRSEYRNQAWTDPVDENDNISPDGGDALMPDVAINNNGDSIISWVQDDGTDLQIFRSEYSDQAWVDPQSLQDSISPAGSDASAPKVAINNNGHRVITWPQIDDGGANQQIFKSEFFKDSWMDPSSLRNFISPSDGGNSNNISVVINDDSEILMVWNQLDSGITPVAATQILLGEHRQSSSPVQLMGLR